MAIQASLPATKKMSLANAIKGKLDRPEKIVIHGPQGVGKSTFAMGSPEAIFLDIEEGTKHLDLTRAPRADGYLDVLDFVRILETEPHKFKTLAIDSADRLERMLWDFICSRDKKADIEDYGYGKGYVAAMTEWSVFVAALDRLVQRKSMNVIIIAHSKIKTFKNPSGEDYDQYQIKLREDAGSYLQEWADHVLFANHEEFAVKDKKASLGTKAKGYSSGKRILYTAKQAAFHAKHRGEIPDKMPLEWEIFADALKASTPEATIEKIKTEIAKMPEEWAIKTGGSLVKAASDPTMLSRLLNWCRVKNEELEAAKPEPEATPAEPAAETVNTNP